MTPKALSRGDWKEKLVSILNPIYPLDELSYKLLTDFITSLLAEQKKELIEKLSEVESLTNWQDNAIEFIKHHE